jgi:hypothetical protein
MNPRPQEKLPGKGCFFEKKQTAGPDLKTPKV